MSGGCTFRPHDEEKRRLDARLAELEAGGPNATEFDVEGRWVVLGYRLEVHAMRERLGTAPPAAAFDPDAAPEEWPSSTGLEPGSEREVVDGAAPAG